MAMNRLLAASVGASATLSIAALVAAPASAVSTRHFSLDDADDFDGGELDGAMLRSDGAVVPGVTTRRVALGDEALAYCIVRGPDGATFIGTGDAGKIFRVRGGEVSAFAQTEQLLVASLAIGGDTLYAGTLPEGRVYAIALGDGATRELVKLPETEHVWALAWDASARRLLAGTGPQGKVFAIDPSGSAEVLFDADQGHILSLAIDGESAYAGTDGEAIVYRLRGGEASIVYDFPGNEVTALDAKGGLIAVAANDMPAPRPVSKTSSSSSSSSTAAARNRSSAGKGRLYRVDADGRAERIHRDDDEHFTAVQILDDAIFVGTGKEGRVLRVAADRTRSTYVDIDERQVTALALDGDTPAFVTADSAALYRVGAAAGENARWTSKALDAGFLARWGRLHWRGEGRIAFRTRSGNSAEPDDTWTAWSAPMSAPGPVRSPASRFVQLRAELGQGAVLRASQVFYLPQNQRATVLHVGAEEASSDSDAPPSPSTKLKLEWRVDNPDGDDLRYRLRFRAEGQQRWRSMLEEDEEVTDSHYTWDTAGIPDGWYVVQVEASDERENPESLTLRDTSTSEPFLVDDHDPEVSVSLRGSHLVGVARDSLGPISKLEYAVDGQDWRLMFPEDQILDEAEERFDVDLGDLAAEGHIIAVRATDAGGNAAVAEVESTGGTPAPARNP